MANYAEGQRDSAEQGKGHEHGHGAERDDEVLPDDGAGATTELEGDEEVFQPVVHQDHLGLLQRGVGTACAHGHANVGRGEAGGIVHAVANHGHALAARGELADGFNLLLRFQPGAHFIHGELRLEMIGGGLVVAGEHDGAEAARTQFIDHGAGLGADVITQRDAAQHGTVRHPDFGDADVPLRRVGGR